MAVDCRSRQQQIGLYLFNIDSINVKEQAYISFLKVVPSLFANPADDSSAATNAVLGIVIPHGYGTRSLRQGF